MFNAVTLHLSSPADPIVAPSDVVELVDATFERLRPRPEPTADMSWDEAVDCAAEPALAHDDGDFTLH